MPEERMIPEPVPPEEIPLGAELLEELDGSLGVPMAWGSFSYTSCCGDNDES